MTFEIALPCRNTQSSFIEELKQRRLNVELLQSCDIDKVVKNDLEARNAAIQEIEEYIEKGADVNYQTYSESPLVAAACAGFTEAVRILLDHGANPNIMDGDGWRPIHWAAYYGWIDICQELVRRGGNIKTQTCKGITALHYAIQRGHLAAASMLVVLGADPYIKDMDGITAIDCAAAQDKIKIETLYESVTSNYAPK